MDWIDIEHGLIKNGVSSRVLLDLVDCTINSADCLFHKLLVRSAKLQAIFVSSACFFPSVFVVSFKNLSVFRTDSYFSI